MCGVCVGGRKQRLILISGLCGTDAPRTTTHQRRQVALNLLLQLVLPLAWDALMLRTFAPKVFRAIAAARRGKRVDAAGEMVQEGAEREEETEEEEEDDEEGAALAVDGGVLVGNVVKALGAWALLYLDVVPWEGVVAMLSVDPAELAMQALEGTKGEEGGGDGLSLPPQAATTIE